MWCVVYYSMGDTRVSTEAVTREKGDYTERGILYTSEPLQEPDRIQ